MGIIHREHAPAGRENDSPPEIEQSKLVDKRRSLDPTSCRNEPSGITWISRREENGAQSCTFETQQRGARRAKSAPKALVLPLTNSVQRRERPCLGCLLENYGK